MDDKMFKNLLAANPGIYLLVRAADLIEAFVAIREMKNDEEMARMRYDAEAATFDRMAAAEFLGIDVTTLDRWVKRDFVPSFKIGHKRLFKESDLIAVLNEKLGEDISE